MNRLNHLAKFFLVAAVLIGFAGCSQNGAIHDAAKAGDLEKVKALLSAHPDLINSKDTNGITLLYIAAYHGNKDLAEFLLANQAEVNARDDFGDTPLNCAALRNHRDVAKLLL